MQGEQASMMVGHYFQKKVEEADCERISSLVDGVHGRPALDITPARLEQLCSEYDTIDTLCDALQKLSMEGAPTNMTLRGGGRTTSTCVEAVLNRAHTLPAQTATS